MLNPFIELLATVLQMYSFIVIVWGIVHMLVSFKVSNPYNPITQRIIETLDKLVEPGLRPIRRWMVKLFPSGLGGLDLSPLVLLLLLQFAQSALFHWF